MKIIYGKLEALQGERFSQVISGFNFDLASQITILLFKDNELNHSKSWVKFPTETYPEALLVTKRESDGKMIFLIDTAGLTSGKYSIECRVDVVGVTAPIVKKRIEFLTLKQSRS